MTKHDQKLKILIVLVCVLLVAVTVLSLSLFRTNAQLASLTTQYAPSEKSTEDDSDFRVIDDPFDANTWDPFKEMQQMQQHIDQIFGDAFGRFGRSSRFDTLMQDFTFNPHADITDEGDHYLIKLDIPGIENTDVQFNLEEQVLTIEAKSKQIDESEEPGKTIQKQRRIGTFRKRITLPEPVDIESMVTEYEDGVFTIKIQKS